MWIDDKKNRDQERHLEFFPHPLTLHPPPPPSSSLCFKDTWDCMYSMYVAWGNTEMGGGEEGANGTSQPPTLQ